MEYSEKYLIGFLEERKRSYVEYIKELIYEHERGQAKFAQYEEKVNAEEDEEEEKGFFRRLFNR